MRIPAIGSGKPHYRHTGAQGGDLGAAEISAEVRTS